MKFSYGLEHQKSPHKYLTYRGDQDLKNCILVGKFYGERMHQRLTPVEFLEEGLCIAVFWAEVVNVSIEVVKFDDVEV